jgi:hypothetical protein
MVKHPSDLNYICFTQSKLPQILHSLWPHLNKNRCTGYLSARETVAAHTTAVFDITFFLHLDLKNLYCHLNQFCHTPVSDLVFNIFEKIKDIVDASAGCDIRRPFSLAVIFCFSVFMQVSEFLAP